MTVYAASARMYAVNARARDAWAALFGWLGRTSGVDLTVVAHAYPKPLSDLWRRPDLACGFVCGFPFTQSYPDLQPIAAPVPTTGPTAGTPRYATQLVVRAEAPFSRLEESFGRRLGYTVPDSYSGCVAMRHFLAPYQQARPGPLYAEMIGPLVTPRRVIETLLAGDIDIGPLDSYALKLMLAGEPDLADRLRIVATTPGAPIPLMVAHGACPASVVTRLRETLTADTADEERDAIFRRLLVDRFAPVARADYSEIKPSDAPPLATAGFPS
jgi:ABC-type phosphate/phosphonate transport system substrate-binding protein